jgi:hypothetical protein
VRIFKNWLYVRRRRRVSPSTQEAQPALATVSEFPKERQHADKTFALDAKGTLYERGRTSNSASKRTGRKVRWVKVRS